MASRDIKAGEELSFNYLFNVQHRNDVTLLSYGFVQNKEPPLMLVTDLPGYTADDLFDETPLTDDDFYGKFSVAIDHKK